MSYQVCAYQVCASLGSYIVGNKCIIREPSIAFCMAIPCDVGFPHEAQMIVFLHMRVDRMLVDGKSNCGPLASFR